MNCKVRAFFGILLLIAVASVSAFPATSSAQEFKTFTSEKYGFTMEYPATWHQVGPDAGQYYLIFNAPDLSDGFRNRIQVTAHKPVKDPLKVFLQETRKGIEDLQKKTAGKDNQEVRILHEQEFKSDYVSDAHLFFIEAVEDKLLMQVAIVFYKHDQTLLRVSCLASAKSMEKLQPVFNRILLSIRFQDSQPQEQTYQQPPRTQPPASPGAMDSRPAAPGTRPAAPNIAPPAAVAPEPEPDSDEALAEPEQRPSSPVPAAPAPTQKPGPRGPLRGPDKPATGIIN